MRNSIKKVMALVGTLAASTAFAADKPNILVFWGDDVGVYNISAYHNGMMEGRLLTLIKSPMKVPFSQTLTHNRVVLPDEPHLFWANIRFVPVY